ncbi:T. brucei spp.-specific protein [Trypanosoma brucei gambiense DAL972]|uniref:T. brucei spp.-specific protein n=2 Tax=Trypanosoma brucei TaxID=5691 RepID=D0A7P3_TRYB9|nr:T. brucei spp.-specific protein [Trypanosoma brucei gambiense DAL972]RHW67083.1 RNA recognition motif [Trypanosoma brucei equiperdum]CBH17694.1 T. brucei spp.-specific protein [Trypanosoma brucei gambiense DAL972]|eukprot:XP_011779958.1 T. brucei spp.-specific protein [Trypanosoma brucei gambiense DAL972]
MGKRDLEKERQIELAAIWGAEVDGENRFPRRRGLSGKKSTGASCLPVGVSVEDVDEVPSDLGSETRSEECNNAKSDIKKKKAGKDRKTNSTYRLHCFVGPGTERNDVRTVFEAYEPKVELRTSQQGNLLNKTHFAVLTFRNKAMALHAVKVLDGTNQYDRLGVRKLKLGLMLSRKEHSKIRQKLRKRMREDHERRLAEEVSEEAEFVKKFIESYVPSAG